jgi:hypothetical protein
MSLFENINKMKVNKWRGGIDKIKKQLDVWYDENIIVARQHEQIANEEYFNKLLMETFKNGGNAGFPGSMEKTIIDLIVCSTRRNSLKFAKMMESIELVNDMDLIDEQKPLLFGSCITNAVIEPYNIICINNIIFKTNKQINQLSEQKMFEMKDLLQTIPNEIKDQILSYLDFHNVKVRHNKKIFDRLMHEIEMAEIDKGEIISYSYFIDHIKLINNTLVKHLEPDSDIDISYIVPSKFNYKNEGSYDIHATKFANEIEGEIIEKNKNKNNYNKSKNNSNNSNKCNIRVYTMDSINGPYDLVFTTKDIFHSNNTNVINTVYYNPNNKCFESTTNMHPIIALLHAVFGIDMLFEEWLESSFSDTKQGLIRIEKLENRAIMCRPIYDIPAINFVTAHFDLIYHLDEFNIKLGKPVFLDEIDVEKLDLIKDIPIEILHEIIKK